MKKYEHFILESNEKRDFEDLLDNLDLYNIVMICIKDGDTYRTIHIDGEPMEKIFMDGMSEKDLKPFYKLKRNTVFGKIRLDLHVIIYCYNPKGRRQIIKMPLNKLKRIFNEIGVKPGSGKSRGYDIEQYQHLGLLYNKRENGKIVLPESVDDVKEEDFDFSLTDEKLDVSFPLTEYYFDLVYGSAKFKRYMERRGDYSKQYNYEYSRHKFEIKKILHLTKKKFLDDLLKKEEYICGKLDIPLNTDKLNTTDIIITDDPDIMKKIGDPKYIVVSEPASEISIKDRLIDEGGVCYLINEDDFDYKKLKDGGIETQKEWMEEQIYKSENATKFIQVSLKKSKTGAQFGKVMKTIMNQFVNSNDKNENVLINIFNKVKDFLRNIKGLIRKFFNKGDKEISEKIDTDTKKIVSGIVSKLNSDELLQENNTIYEPIELTSEFIDKEKENFFLFVEDEKVKKLKNLEFKKQASIKIDNFIKETKNKSAEIDTKKLHDKFAEILTVSLMGGTNLPLYLVFGTNSKSDYSYTLHKYRIEKKQKHIDDALKHNLEFDDIDIKIPMYIAHIKNHKDGDEIVYRTLNIYVYNYSSMTDRYIAVNMRTSSSSTATFVAETTVPKDKYISELLNRIEKYIKNNL